MEEILALKLDADWVVLSACNTGTGAGAGAEAASGLGRAFFYAGTRALLVTNWSVHSQSARELVTDLFSRQAARSETDARRSAAAGHDGPGGRSRLCWTPTARPISPMRIRCSGRPTPSSATAACDSVGRETEAGNYDRANLECGIAARLYWGVHGRRDAGAGGAAGSDHGGRGRLAAAQGRGGDRAAGDYPRPEGRRRHHGPAQIPDTAAVEIRALWRFEDRSRLRSR